MDMNNSSNIKENEWSEEKANSRLEVNYENLPDTIDRLIEIVLNSDEFNALKDKTQILFMKEDTDKDVRNRQSHTKDVANLSKQLAEKENMPEEFQKLVYLMGLCHDLGHTALGHDGESRINKALQAHGMSAKEFDAHFREEQGIAGGPYELGAVNPDYSFEHHAHSVRVLTKILKQNNVVLSAEVREDINYGILCHSTSRMKNETVKKPLWAFARFADKIYPYTDMYDILQVGVNVDPSILLEINKKPEYFKKDEARFTEEDVILLEEAIKKLKEPDGLIKYLRDYVDNSELQKDVKIDELGNTLELSRFVSTGNIGPQAKALKKTAEYLRQEGLLGKKELYAQAMVDEVIEYIFTQNVNNGMDSKDAIYKASVILTQLTDTKLREIYKEISQDKEWVEQHAGEEISYLTAPSQRIEEYPIKLSPSEIKKLRENPDIILQPVFGQMQK